MNGILIIDKPTGITSHDVVSRVRRILKTKRVGHTGTLDPFATGVLVILVGQSTRLAQFIDKDEKEYEAVMRFGFETDTGDITGMRNAECGMRDEEIAERLRNADWDAVMSEFRGEIEQVPPMYSAKKVAGKKLYEYARKGEIIERKLIRVSITELELLDPSPINQEPGTWTLKLRVVCSAGTYIRTLAEDIGRKLGTAAHLAELRRTRAGRFDLFQSLTLDRLESLDDPTTAFSRLSEAIEHLPSVTLAADRAEKTRNGLATHISELKFPEGQPVRMLDKGNNLLAVGFYNEAERSIRPKVVLV